MFPIFVFPSSSQLLSLVYATSLSLSLSPRFAACVTDNRDESIVFLDIILSPSLSLSVSRPRCRNENGGQLTMRTWHPRFRPPPPPPSPPATEAASRLRCVYLNSIIHNAWGVRVWNDGSWAALPLRFFPPAESPARIKQPPRGSLQPLFFV